MSEAEAELETKLSRFRVAELKVLLRNQGLPLSGRKAELIDRLKAAARRQGVDKFLAEVFPSVPGSQSSSSQYTSNGGYGFQAYDLFEPDIYEPWFQPPVAPSVTDSSVFTNGEEVLTKLAKSSIIHRYVSTVSGCSLLTEGCQSTVHVDMTHYPNLYARHDPFFKVNRVLVYCTNLLNTQSEARHQWPTMITISANGKSVDVLQQCPTGKHRNKALLERPADIRSQLTYRTGNVVKFNVPYPPESEASFRSQWVAGIFLCHEIPTKELVDSLTRKTKEESLETIRKVFGDDDVICDEMLVKVCDPVTFQRIEVPVKTIHCTHVQCFDATNFFDFERCAKNASWACYYCKKKVKAANELVIDPWFEQVLEGLKTQPDVDEVQYFKDGTWKAKLEDEESTPTPTNKRTFESAFEQQQGGEHQREYRPEFVDGQPAVQRSSSVSSSGVDNSNVVILLESDDEG